MKGGEPLDQSIVELVEAAEEQARQIKETAERERMELIRQGEIAAQQYLDEQQQARRTKKQEYMIAQAKQAQDSAEKITVEGRAVLGKLEASAKQNMAKAVEVILRKVL